MYKRQLVTNNVVSLKSLSRKNATANEKSLNVKYKKAVDEAVDKISSDLKGKGTEYNDFNDEYQEYCDYIYELLKNDGILLSSSINLEDETYLKYVEGSLSLNDFIKYAIKMNWIDLDNLDIQDAYLSTGETYDVIRKHIIKDLKKNSSFGKLVVKYRILDSTISGSEICMLLYDQKILEKDESTYHLLATHEDVYKRQNPDCVIAFCKGIQAAAPVDSYLTPEPWDMPGYDAPVIMAAGAFVSGSSIELSADGPMKPPYAVYFQCGLTSVSYTHLKSNVIKFSVIILKFPILLRIRFLIIMCENRPLSLIHI